MVAQEAVVGSYSLDACAGALEGGLYFGVGEQWCYAGSGYDGCEVRFNYSIFSINYFG